MRFQPRVIGVEKSVTESDAFIGFVIADVRASAVVAGLLMPPITAFIAIVFVIGARAHEPTM